MKGYELNDCHLHVGRSGWINQSIMPEQIEKFRKQSGVGKMLAMSLEQNIQENNDRIFRMSIQYSFLKALLWVTKEHIYSDATLLQQELDHKLVGIKFHGTFENLPVTAKFYEPIFEILNERKAIALVHNGRYKDGARESNTSYIHALELAKKYPNLQVIMAHMGGNDTQIIKRAIEAGKDLNNVYYDTAGCASPFEIEHAVKTIGSKRIIFGSDAPWCSFKSMMYNVMDASISSDEKSDIFSANMERLIA